MVGCLSLLYPKLTEKDEETEETDPKKEKSEIDNYTGVSIKVSTPGLHDTMTDH